MNATEILRLREKPLFEIAVQKDGFKIHNEADSNDNGFYELDKINHLDFEKRRINWFVSISSFIVDLFSESGTGGIFRERNQLKLHYKNAEKRIILDDCNLKIAELAIQKIKRRAR